MRILTVRQPWAWAIVHGGKDVENRVRNIAGAYRGPVAIHAGLALDLEAIRSSDRDGGPLHWAFQRGSARLEVGIPPWRGWFGNIIGLVDLVDSHHETSDRCGDSLGLCSDWGEVGTHHLVLANPRPLAQPIPTQDGETGASLRAAGFRVIAKRPPRGGWDMPSRPRVETGPTSVARTLWEAIA